MPQRTRIFIVIGLIIGLAALGGGVWWFMNRDDAPTPTENTATVNADQGTTTGSGTTGSDTTGGATTETEEQSVEQTAQASALRIARIFAERYGTYSNRNNFENITSLAPFMTQGFYQQSQEFIAEQESADPSAERYGITTNVASIEMSNFTPEETAVVRVVARRIETVGSADPRIFEQEAEVVLRFVENTWRVQNFEWL